MSLACGSDDLPASAASEPAQPPEAPAVAAPSGPAPSTPSGNDAPPTPPVADTPSESSVTPPLDAPAAIDVTTGTGASEVPESETPPPAGDSSTMSPLPDLVRIVAIGDSTTQSTCWRALLWRELEQDFPGRTEFVGSHASDSNCMVAGSDQDNEAYGSALVTDVVAGVTNRTTCNPACPTLDDLSQRFVATPADVAFLHFATNDVWNGIAPGDPNNPAPGTILAAYGAIVEALRDSNPDIRILAAQLIPLNPVNTASCSTCACPACGGRVTALNTAITAWSARMSTAASPISVVDQWSGFDSATDTGDGVHPNASGSQKMAERWYAALAPLL